MPIFEYHCYTHGIFEAWQTKAEDWFVCPVCGILCEWIPSRVTMRPDTLWAGHVDKNYGYLTSATKRKEIMQRKNHITMGDRTDREAMEKVADEANKAKDEKLQKDMRKWSEKTFGSEGLGLGGADGEKFIRENCK